MCSISRSPTICSNIKHERDKRYRSERHAFLCMFMPVRCRSACSQVCRSGKAASTKYKKKKKIDCFFKACILNLDICEIQFSFFFYIAKHANHYAIETSQESFFNLHTLFVMKKVLGNLTIHIIIKFNTKKSTVKV